MTKNHGEGEAKEFLARLAGTTDAAEVERARKLTWSDLEKRRAQLEAAATASPTTTEPIRTDLLEDLDLGMFPTQALRVVAGLPPASEDEVPCTRCRHPTPGNEIVTATGVCLHCLTRLWKRHWQKEADNQRFAP